MMALSRSTLSASPCGRCAPLTAQGLATLGSTGQGRRRNRALSVGPRPTELFRRSTDHLHNPTRLRRLPCPVDPVRGPQGKADKVDRERGASRPQERRHGAENNTCKTPTPGASPLLARLNLTLRDNLNRVPRDRRKALQTSPLCLSGQERVSTRKGFPCAPTGGAPVTRWPAQPQRAGQRVNDAGAIAPAGAPTRSMTNARA